MVLDRHYLLWALVVPLLAALLWATYFIFVLAVTPGTAPSAVFVLPFLFGGAAYAIWAWAEGHGATFLALWADPAAWLRIGLLAEMQLAVLASTYVAGPVDTSLLTLIGDVVLTPIIVSLGIAAYRGRLGSRVLWAGMGLCVLGGALAIVGTGRLVAVHAWDDVLLVAIPVSVAVYFLLSARANEHAPASAVVGQTVLGAGVVGLVLAAALPGGYAGLVRVAPGPLLLLIVTGVTSFFLAYAMYFASFQHAGYVVPPMMMTGIPVFAALLGWGVLGIAIPLLGVIGIPVAVAGSLVALRGERSEGPPAAAPG